MHIVKEYKKCQTEIAKDNTKFLLVNKKHILKIYSDVRIIIIKLIFFKS